jgi:hypothetical protein
MASTTPIPAHATMVPNMTPHAIEHAIRRALCVVQLLDLGPDVSNCPTSSLPS